MAAILDFQLTVSRHDVDVGFIEMSDPETCGLPVGILIPACHEGQVMSQNTGSVLDEVVEFSYYHIPVVGRHIG